MTDENPLLTAWTTPFGMPPFAAIRPEHYRPAFETAIAEVFDHLGRPAQRTGNLWSAPDPLFELEPFAAGKCVALSRT